MVPHPPQAILFTNGSHAGEPLLFTKRLIEF